MDRLGQNLRLAIRGLARTKGFTAAVLITLALGIGANAGIFSVVNGILLRPLPFSNPDRVVFFSHVSPYGLVSDPEFIDYRRDMKTMEVLAAWAPGENNLTGGLAPERVSGAAISDHFFEALGVAPIRGRAFSAEEEAPARGPSPVVMISYGLWQRYYGGDPNIVGRTIDLNETPRTVIGVMPPGLDFPSRETAILTPLRLNPDSLWTRNNHYLMMVGRLRPNATVESARTEAGVLTSRWGRDYPEIYPRGKPLVAQIKPIRDWVAGSTRPYLLALLGAATLVLLIGCVNVANLLLVRGEARRGELAIRSALGASGNELAKQLLVESGLLATAGGLLGLLIAWVGTRSLLGLAPSSIPRLDQIGIDRGVLIFTLLVSTVTGMLFGLLPALRAARSNSMDALRQGGRRADRHMGRRARVVLVVSEVALAVTLLAGAGLLIRSLRALQAMDPGFDPSGITIAKLNLPPRSYDDARILQFIDRLEERIGGLPDVERVAVMGWAPVLDGWSGWSILIDGHVTQTIAEAPVGSPQQVSADYFQLMGIPVKRGRVFTRADRQDGAPVVVVNETMARQLWPGQDPVGHQLKMFGEEAPWATIVGVVGDVRPAGVESPVPPTMFFPYHQAGRSAYYVPRSMTLAVKTRLDQATAAGLLKRAVSEEDPNVPVSDIRSMDSALGSAFASRRFTTALLGLFAALALVLAGIGIYGVVAYGVSQRTFEIGLRLALGAQRGSVLKTIVVSESGRIMVVGLAIGLAGALVVGRVVRSLLVGVSAVDPFTIGAVVVTLAGVGLLASMIPARRAMAVSPTEALRGE